MQHLPGCLISGCGTKAKWNPFLLRSQRPRQAAGSRSSSSYFLPCKWVWWGVWFGALWFCGAEQMVNFLDSWVDGKASPCRAAALQTARCSDKSGEGSKPCDLFQLPEQLSCVSCFLYLFSPTIVGEANPTLHVNRSQETDCSELQTTSLMAQSSHKHTQNVIIISTEISQKLFILSNI